MSQDPHDPRDPQVPQVPGAPEAPKDIEEERRSLSEAEELDLLQRAFEETAALGIKATVDPDVADHMAAFEEDAISLEDAEDSMVTDWAEDQE